MKEFWTKLLEKITSRKFLSALLVIGVGVAVAFGVDASTVERIVGAAFAVLGGMSYIFVEGGVDVQRLTQTVNSLEDLKEGVEDAIDQIKGKETSEATETTTTTKEGE